jgi:hypothetical protein
MVNESEISFETWTQLDTKVRKDAGDWAALMTEALSLDEGTDVFGEVDRAVARYRALSRAAKVSHSVFLKQWKKSIGDLEYTADIAEDLKRESVHFRRPDTLIRHAMRSTEIELGKGRRALSNSKDYEDWENRIRYSWDPRLVIDHAVYALYVAWHPQSRVLIPDSRPRLLGAMALDESLFRVVSPREFEELVAYVYECLGCKVEVTQASRDFGADILAWHGGPFNSETLIAIQVKRYGKEHKVGLKSIFELHGAVAHYSADSGHIVTSSDFTTPARQFAQAQRIHLVNLSKFQEELLRLFRT